MSGLGAPTSSRLPLPARCWCSPASAATTPVVLTWSARPHVFSLAYREDRVARDGADAARRAQTVIDGVHEERSW